MSSEYDVAKVRAHFPSLESGLAFFDGPGGSQTPDVVAEAVRATLVGPLSNRGDLTVAQQNAERAVVGAREALADLLGADPRGHRVRAELHPADLRPERGRWPRSGGPATRSW